MTFTVNMGRGTSDWDPFIGLWDGNVLAGSFFSDNNGGTYNTRVATSDGVDFAHLDNPPDAIGGNLFGVGSSGDLVIRFDLAATGTTVTLSGMGGSHSYTTTLLDRSGPLSLLIQRDAAAEEHDIHSITFDSDTRLPPYQPNDADIPDLIYNASTGEVVLDPDESFILGYVLKNNGFDSYSGEFLDANHTTILGGLSTSLPGEISESTFTAIAAPASIGNVFPTSMNLSQLEDFLTVNQVSRGFGYEIVPFDLVVIGPAVPEPSTYAMAAIGLLGLGLGHAWKKNASRRSIA